MTAFTFESFMHPIMQFVCPKQPIGWDGEPVSKGQVLVEFDNSQTNADRQRLEYELLAAGFNLARQQAMISRLSRRGEPEEPIEWPTQFTAASWLRHACHPI
ncbi:hypothetical protein A8C75_04640 [Marinobacterium aestuarii]|uniref:Membrane fusion protein biotin-lipoyl like domain-containing protein n=1 Tax=Marinobacterium aestuarii TaxID=1821621 RepID=A0A1A9EVH1_9GAMM|nr:hypothetical protein A8C75_04640 [Marinobacterium aestuarii]